MAEQEKINPEELRYNYLGFEFAPGKLDDFWVSEDEKKSYVEKIRARFGKAHTIERDFSMVNAKQLNKADRYVISFASLLMVISLFIPYYNFEAFGSRVIGSPISYLLNIGYISNFVTWGGLIMKITFVLSIFMILFSPLLGVLNIVSLNTGLQKSDYFSKLKKVGKLNLLVLILYLVMFVFAAAGQPNPFGSMGIEALGENFTLLSLLSLSSFSLWLNIGAHFLGIIPAMEL